MSTIIVEKPCEKCGCEIHPLKTDYTPQRRHCKDCRNEANAKRYQEYYEKRRRVSMELGLVNSVDCCLVCQRSLRKLRNRSKYCSQECSKRAVTIKKKVRSLAMMDRRIGEIKESQKKIRKEIRVLKREMLQH